MKFVKKITLLMTFCVMAFGNMDRINALGGNPGFWPEDDANVSAFPAMINSLDMVQVTGAGSGNGTAKVIWGEGTTWGFSFDGATDNNDHDMLNLMWGNGTYGVNFSLGMSSSDDGVAGTTDGDGLDGAKSTTEFGTGFGMNMDFGEIGVNFSLESEDGGVEGTEYESTTALGFNLRRAQDLWLFDNVLASFNMRNTSNYANVDGALNNYTALDVDLFTSLPTGSGVNATFALGFGFWNNAKNTAGSGDDVVTTMISLPSVNLGVEADVTDWATVRFGMSHAYTISGSQDDATWMGSSSLVEGGANGWSEESNFNWNFGLGFDYGSFTLDMVLDDGNLFNDPVRYVTGRNATALSSSATLTWNF